MKIIWEYCGCESVLSTSHWTMFFQYRTQMLVHMIVNSQVQILREDGHTRISRRNYSPPYDLSLYSLNLTLPLH